MFWLIVGSLFFGFLGTLLLIYSIKRGYLKDEEEVKYQVFYGDEEDNI